MADEIDAIKWARYRDSRKDRPDGIKGWVSLAIHSKLINADSIALRSYGISSLLIGKTG